MKKKIILSFDYELFFGDRSGTVQKSIIEPTYKILDALDSVGAKGNFFVDWQMLKYLALEKDERCQYDHTAIVEQLKDMVRRGHRIELHIHPHWVDAKYNGDGTWNFTEYRHYMLSTFTDEQIVNMFEEGVSLLQSIAREVDPSYKIVAFRAGGWAVQPFSKLRKAFRKTEIKIDSSASYGAFNLKEDQKYDFRDMPTKQVYKFSEDVTKEEEHGEFIEVSISSYWYNFFYKVIYFIYSKTDRFERLSDGVHTRAYDPLEIVHKSTLMEKLFKRYRVMFTISQYPTISLVIASILHKSDILCVIDHPKDFSKETLFGLCTMCKMGISITYKELLDNYC